MTWDPSPELVERFAAAVRHGIFGSGEWVSGVHPPDVTRQVVKALRAAVDSGELIPRERVEVAPLSMPCPVGSPEDLDDHSLDCDCGFRAALALYTQEPKG